MYIFSDVAGYPPQQPVVPQQGYPPASYPAPQMPNYGTSAIIISA